MSSKPGCSKRKSNNNNETNHKIIKIENNNDNNNIKIKNLSDFNLKSCYIKLETIDVEKYNDDEHFKGIKIESKESIQSDIISNSNNSEIKIIENEINNPDLIPEIQKISNDNKIIYYKILYLCTICCLYHCNELNCKSINEHLHDNCENKLLRTIYECITCKSKFTGLEFIKEHMCKKQIDNTIEIKQYHCSVQNCNQICHSLDDINTHSKLEHKIKKLNLLIRARMLYQCKKCCQFFNTNDDVINHENILCLMNDIPWKKCTVNCYYISNKTDTVEIKNEKDLDTHSVKNCLTSIEINSNHVTKDTLTFCHYCNILIQKSMHITHLNEHKKVSVDCKPLECVTKVVYKCKLCNDDLYFRNEELLHKHIYNVHDIIIVTKLNDEDIIVNTIQKFSKLSTEIVYVKYEKIFIKDELITETLVANQHTCPVCETASFKTIEATLDHMYTLHKDDKVFSSNEVDYGIITYNFYRYFCKICKMRVENVTKHLDWHKKCIYVAVS